MAFRYAYDLANRKLRAESLDAGVEQHFYDAAGHVIERCDAKGALILGAYDALGRPTALWARDRQGQGLTLRERRRYGDSLEEAEARAANAIGVVYEVHDEAGRIVHERHDFKGNPLERVRQVLANEPLLADPDFRVDWQPAANESLGELTARLCEQIAHRTSIRYDALDRPVAIQVPTDIENRRRTITPGYSRGGSLERLDIDGQAFVERIAYDAKGQRTLMALGNGVMTRWAYDPKTFRARRMRSESYSFDARSTTYRPNGAARQDTGYLHDLAGNLLTASERSHASGVGTDALDRTFAYDPVYRLISATGREGDRPALQPPWLDAPQPPDATRTRTYREAYEYDAIGNLLGLRHRAAGGDFTRIYEVASGSNRLTSLQTGQVAFAYRHDPSGNVVAEGTSRHFEWDHANRLRRYESRADAAEPTVRAVYLYDSDGQRVKKVVRKQGGQTETTVYIESHFETHRVVDGRAANENAVLHLRDGMERIATVRIGEPLGGDLRPAVQYPLADHLGSAGVTLDDAGATVSREEYTPYGETSFGSFARKRYRFAGKERDEESGLVYQGARYYAPWTGRWHSTDPAGPVDGTSLYGYARDNPVNFVDPEGEEPVPSALGEGLRKALEQAMQRVGAAAAGGEAAASAASPAAAGMAGAQLAAMSSVAWGASVVGAIGVALHVHVTRSGSLLRNGTPFHVSREDASFPVLRVRREMQPSPAPAPEKETKTPSPVPPTYEDDDRRRRREILFGQARIDPKFSPKGEVPKEIAGKSLTEVRDMLLDGKLSPDRLKIHVFEHKGQLVAINNRGLAVLSMAKMRPTNVAMRAPSKNERGRLNEPSVAGGPLPSRTIAVTESKMHREKRHIIYIVEIHR